MEARVGRPARGRPRRAVPAVCAHRAAGASGQAAATEVAASRKRLTMWPDVRKIVALAWPVLIGQLAIIAFGVIDTAMVGRYSATDLAALGLGSSIYISIYIGLTGILTALQPIAGQLYGARRESEIGEEVRQALWLAAALSVLGFVCLYF